MIIKAPGINKNSLKPPKNRSVMMMLAAIIFVYSPMKNIAHLIPLYSVP